MIRITPTQPNWLELTTDTLRAGKIVLHPTDTAYGLAVDALNEEAVNRLNQLCKRHNKPYILLVRDLEQANKYAEVDKLAEKLIRQFWPGALTLVLKKRVGVPNVVTGGRSTVALRQPDHPVIKQLSSIYPHPYTSTSANPTGGKTPYTPDEALAQFPPNSINLVIDIGRLNEKPTSTILDLTQEQPQILRRGAITEELLYRYLN